MTNFATDYWVYFTFFFYMQVLCNAQGCCTWWFGCRQDDQDCICKSASRCIDEMPHSYTSVQIFFDFPGLKYLYISTILNMCDFYIHIYNLFIYIYIFSYVHICACALPLGWLSDQKLIWEMENDLSRNPIAEHNISALSKGFKVEVQKEVLSQGTLARTAQCFAGEMG